MDVFIFYVIVRLRYSGRFNSLSRASICQLMIIIMIMILHLLQVGFDDRKKKVRDSHNGNERGQAAPGARVLN